jgi:glycosyltransferase involved in cell wall biosynthesis
VKLGIFIDGTFIPARDGASARFAEFPRTLAEAGLPLAVFHCYRGWSDLVSIANAPFRTYFCPPTLYYNDLSNLVAFGRKERLDVIQMNDAETIMRIGYPLAHALGAKIVYEAHYHTSTLAMALEAPDATVDRLRRLEGSVAEHVDAVIVFTEADRARWLDSGCCADRVHVIPFGVTDVVTTAARTDDHRLVFLGNLYYEPNRRAFERLAFRILPGVRALLPDTTAMLVGDAPPDVRALCVEKDIEAVGEVKELTRTLQRASVGLAPIAEGTGVRVKILEYLAAGLPVVASSIGAESLALPGVLIADTVDDQIQACFQLLTERERYAEDLRGTLALLADEYRWRTIAGRAVPVYRGIAEQPPRNRDRPAGENCGLPIWIEEVVSKGRFSDARSNQATWGLAEGGVVHVSV